MSEYLKFVCPKCDCSELILTETNATVERRIKLPRAKEVTGFDRYLSTPDVVLATFGGYHCERCGYELPISDNYTHQGLRQYLEHMTYNGGDGQCPSI